MGAGMVPPIGGLPGMASPSAQDGVRQPGMYNPDALKAGDIKQDPTSEDDKKTLDQKLGPWIQEKWQGLRTAYTVYHMNCWQNILYYANQLWIKYDNIRKLWGKADPEDDWTPQPLVNYFAPAADSIVSIFKVPEVECIPRVEDNMDAHEVAEVANALADWFRSENGLTNLKDNQESKGHTAAQLFVLCGNVLTRVRKKKATPLQRPRVQQVQMIDADCPTCGWHNRLPMEQAQATQGMCPECQGQLNEPQPLTITQPARDPVTGKQLFDQVPQWQVVCDITNPLHWLPRAGSKSPQDSRFSMLALRMCVDDIYEEWGYEARPDQQFLDSMESSWEIALNFFYTGYSSMTEATKDSALVVIVFIEPGKVKDIPEGGVAVWCNETVINYESWEEACAVGHQMTHGGYLKMPTTYFYRTSMFEVAGVQTELNRYEALIALHGMTSASDTIVVDDNTAVTGLTGRGDIIAHYRSLGPGSVPPHRMQHGSLDDGIYKKHQQLRDQIQNISATVNVWRGEQAGSVTAAAAISQLRGQAEQMFSDPVENWQKMWVETHRKGVKLLQQTMEPWQIASIMGQGHDVQIMKFKQAKLDDMVDWLATSHGLPRTRDEKRQDMLALYDRQALDVGDPGVKVRIVELFGETGMEQQFNRDATRARAENDLMKNGQKPSFMPDIEDLATHLYIHGEHIKRLDFDKYPDGVKQLFFAHYLETKMALAGLMQMQAGDAGAAGGPPAPPGPEGAGAASGPGGGAAPGGEGERGGAPGGGKPKARPQPHGKPGPKRQSAPGRPGPTNQIATPTGPGGPQ